MKTITIKINPFNFNYKPFVHILAILGSLFLSSTNSTVTPTVKLNPVTEYETVFDYVVQTEDVFVLKDTVVSESAEKAFLRIKHSLISETLINNGANRLQSLADTVLIRLNKEIAISFIEIILKSKNPPKNVVQYLTDNTDLNKIETALMEQAKYNVPASIKLAQSALETGYGRRIVDNNYFGIKDTKRKKKAITTTEYYTKSEYKANRAIIQSSKQVIKNGQNLYKCIVKDHFAGYASPWHSFREHSKFLANSKRYAPLFTRGKNYEDWADKIGSTKYGGVGYATSPIYGQTLKKIIQMCGLDLLDY